MASLARTRLAEERKNWRKDRPFGFVAKPVTKDDGSVDLLRWKCIVLGKEGTHWEGGHYPVDLYFSEQYPTKAPLAKFPAGFFHVNVFDDGKVCLSILNDDPDMGGQWAPSITMKQILLGIQELLTNPNDKSPAQATAYNVYKKDRRKYDAMVREQAKKHQAPDDD